MMLCFGSVAVIVCISVYTVIVGEFSSFSAFFPFLIFRTYTFSPFSSRTVFRRQNRVLTSKDGLHGERVKICIMAVDP